MNTLHKTSRLCAGRSLSVLTLLLACASVDTAEAATEDLLGANSTLTQLIDHAMADNAALRAARLRWEAAGHRVAQARGWPDPKLSYGYFAQPVETRVGPQEQRIGVMQPLLWFGKLKAAGDVAGEEAAAALAEFEAVRLSVVQQVRETWFDLYFLERSLRITQENIDLLKQLEAVAQTKFRAGSPLSPVTKAQVELGKLQDRVSSLNEMREPLEFRMNALLNRPNGSPLPSPDTLPPDATALPGNSLLFAWQQEASPILEALSSRIQKEEYAIRLARKQGLPNLGVGVDYIVTGPARVAGTPDSGQDAIIAMFSIDIPLWRGKYKAAVREAEARRGAAESTLQEQSNQLVAQLQMAIYGYRDAERKVSLYSTTLLPQARSALNVSRQNYESGSADFLNLIDAQRVLLEFELEHQRALANREQARARVDMLVGRDSSAETRSRGTTQ
jgi:cobalt-zinc-cadmium efflux system outer membrane protein